MDRSNSPFNSALETGLRTLSILVASYPRAHDLNRLVQYDYLTVHSADAGGPPSLHPPLPLRSGELLVRRGLIERGALLMRSRGLLERRATEDGFMFYAEDMAGAFLRNIRAKYLKELFTRAEWVTKTFDGLTNEEVEATTKNLFRAWTTEFQAPEHPNSDGYLL